MPFCKFCGKEITEDQSISFNATCQRCLPDLITHIQPKGNYLKGVLCEWGDCINDATRHCKTCGRPICPAHSVVKNRNVHAIKCPSCAEKDAKKSQIIYIVAGVILAGFTIVVFIIRFF